MRQNRIVGARFSAKVEIIMPNAQNSNNTQKRKRGNPWPKGVSGNPGGRPVLPKELKIMCQGKAADAMRVALEILNDADQPAAARLKAADIILDRGYGTPTQTIDADIKGDSSIKVTYVNDWKQSNNTTLSASMATVSEDSEQEV
jgi:hypothetical protein